MHLPVRTLPTRRNPSEETSWRTHPLPGYNSRNREETRVHARSTTRPVSRKWRHISLSSPVVLETQRRKFSLLFLSLHTAGLRSARRPSHVLLLVRLTSSSHCSAGFYNTSLLYLVHRFIHGVFNTS
ncbi:hypothetical protein PLICRDRAFT_409449 [Plicaturopsis crispa FD-325 SS-3]|nr:hypothetical protein PLICRDRAFT_409449 [Plicaturopsis crispa FD-325 SS-3]